MFLYSACLDRLVEEADVEIWASSASHAEHRHVWAQSKVTVTPYPEVDGFPEFPHNFLRRVNERAWDWRQRLPSRLSMNRHVRDANGSLRDSVIRVLGSLVGITHTHQLLERGLEELLLRYPRSPQAAVRMAQRRPDLVLTTGPYWYLEPAVAAQAQRMGIPVVAMIPSWDNVTTKNRMVYRYDGFLVWSGQAQAELHEIYPYTRDRRIAVIGASQFDVFHQARFQEERDAFCHRQGLRPDLPIIVYAIGSPHFIKGEHFGALELANRIQRGELGAVQMLVRPHPTKDNAELTSLFARYHPQVVVQSVAQPGTEVSERSQGEAQVTDWVSTFRHASVVVNLASTVTVDAALMDKPVVNVNFDPSPGAAQEELIKDVNSIWSHFRPIAQSGGLELVNNPEELVAAVISYLDRPDLHRKERRWIAEHVCGFVDGKCGERMAGAILDLLPGRGAGR